MKYHKKEDVYDVSRTIDAEYFESDLCEIGKNIRAYYSKAGKARVQVELQIDSAGGHGTARGNSNFEKLAAMMLKNFSIVLKQQPGNTPMCKILDLTIWQASQLEVDKMNGATRQREDELVKVCKKAWEKVPPV